MAAYQVGEHDERPWGSWEILALGAGYAVKRIIVRPAARVSLTKARGNYRKGTQDVTFPTYTRYVADAADMARVIRGEKRADFPAEHDLAVQETLLRACGVPPRD